MIRNERKFIVLELLERRKELLSSGNLVAAGCSTVCTAVVGIQFMDLYRFEVFVNSVFAFENPITAVDMPGGWHRAIAKPKESNSRFKQLGDRQIGR